MAQNTKNPIFVSLLKGWGRVLVLVVCFWVMVVSPAGSETFREYQVKAVFLYNLANFVEWPETAFNGPKAALTIGLWGGDPFGTFLDKTVANEKNRGRSIRVVRYSRLQEVLQNPCQILFITANQAETWPQLRSKIATTPVLTVADQAPFTRQGGMISLIKSGNRILLEINLENARSSGLTISAKLLSLAKLIESTPSE